MARLCHAKGVIHVLIRGDLPAKAARRRYQKLYPVNSPAGTTGIESPGICGKAPAHGCVKNKVGQTG